MGFYSERKKVLRGGGIGVVGLVCPGAEEQGQDVVLQASTFDYTEGSHTGTRKWNRTDKKISCKQSINFRNIRKKNEKNQKELGEDHDKDKIQS